MALGSSEGITQTSSLCPQRTWLGAHAAPRFYSHGLALSPTLTPPVPCPQPAPSSPDRLSVNISNWPVTGIHVGSDSREGLLPCQKQKVSLISQQSSAITTPPLEVNCFSFSSHLPTKAKRLAWNQNDRGYCNSPRVIIFLVPLASKLRLFLLIKGDFTEVSRSLCLSRRLKYIPNMQVCRLKCIPAPLHQPSFSCIAFNISLEQLVGAHGKDLQVECKFLEFPNIPNWYTSSYLASKNLLKF